MQMELWLKNSEMDLDMVEKQKFNVLGLFNECLMLKMAAMDLTILRV